MLIILQTGTQSIAKGIACLVGHENIRLSTPVKSIQDENGRVTVTSHDGRDFQASKAIVTLPSTLYREIEFAPALPIRLQEVAGATRLGHYNKALVFYKTPWWRTLGFNGFMMSFRGPVCVARDTSVDRDGVFGFTCFLNGRVGEEWASRSPDERRTAVLDQLAAAFGLEADLEAHRPLDYQEQVWMDERYSQGALAPITALGHYVEYADVYGKPVGNIHFAGTEFSRHWKGYLEGALTSGDETARLVVKSLLQRG